MVCHWRACKVYGRREQIRSELAGPGNTRSILVTERGSRLVAERLTRRARHRGRSRLAGPRLQYAFGEGRGLVAAGSGGLSERHG